ncbi:peroxisomal membrane protein 2-like isoform X1 [Acropora millepora]|uniref:peroxisomal membrane protein 2-like isoform X1 n=1 Tax=Acropora millepora TaxID=45264 RepID=UPI001CF356DF|nr:peroxisomal membrane protein 2-like isoform X1 [Acropora millepora]
MASSSGSGSRDEDKAKSLLVKLATKYNHYLRTNPVLTKSITSAVTAGLGNIVSQKIQKRGKNLPLEYRPVIAFSAYGFFLSGPLIHYFYEFLDKFIPKTASYSKAKRLLIDRGVMSPALLLVFFYVVAILEGKSHEGAIRKIGQHYWTALKMSWRVWIIFQFFNLNYVPRESFSWKHDVVSLECLFGWQGIRRAIQDWKINFPHLSHELCVLYKDLKIIM